MSWLFSQALVEEYLVDTSLDGEQSAPLSGNPTQLAYCAPDKMTAFSRLSRFGMMYKPLTESRGEALLMSYLAGFHAKTSPQRGGGAGIDGERSGMWREMARIIGEVRPRYAFVENSPMLVSRGLGRVLADLSSMGYDSRWGVVSAANIGANHKRERIWIVANSKHSRHSNQVSGINEEALGLQGEDRQERGGSRMPVRTGGVVRNGAADRLHNQRVMADSNIQHVQGQQCSSNSTGRQESILGQFALRRGASDRHWWKTEPDVGRVADGVAARVDRLKAIGNGQVPLCAATAWRILSAE